MRKLAPKKLSLRPEVVRVLQLRDVRAGYQNTPITPECPSEYPMCTPT